MGSLRHAIVLLSISICVIVDSKTSAVKQDSRNFGFLLPKDFSTGFRQISLEGRQYTFDVCKSDEDCESPRVCISDELSACPGSGVCFCASTSYIMCVTSNDCLPMDRCSLLEDGDKTCLSCSFDPYDNMYESTPVDAGNCDNSSTSATPSTTRLPASSTSPRGTPISSPGICISSDALTHIKSSALVFAAHKRASVLCDQHESCATPGHMVIFNRVPMSMNDYCTQPGVFCIRRVKKVNSPKMKLGLRITSRSQNLEFTALAATKETWAEKTLLKIFLYSGAWSKLMTYSRQMSPRYKNISCWRYSP